MESLSEQAQRIVREAYRLESVLSEKTLKLTPAAAEDLRTSLGEILNRLSSYSDQLYGRYVETHVDARGVQAAVYPYRAERVVPLRNGGFLAFAETEQARFELPRSSEDETGASSNEIPVSIYIDSDDPDEISAVVEGVQGLARVLGYVEVGEAEIRRGSFIRRSRAVAQQGMEELKSRLMKVERGLELAQLDLRQAEVDVKESEAVSNLLTALENTQRVCAQVGSVFVVKYVANGHQVVLVRNLTQLEMHALTSYPEIQNHPEQAMQALATAIASMPEPDGNGDGEALPQGAS